MLRPPGEALQEVEMSVCPSQGDGARCTCSRGGGLLPLGALARKL